MSLIGTAITVALILNLRIRSIETQEEKALHVNKTLLPYPLSGDFKEDGISSFLIKPDRRANQFVSLSEEIIRSGGRTNFLRGPSTDDVYRFKYRQRREHRFMPYLGEYHQYNVSDMQDKNEMEKLESTRHIQDTTLKHREDQKVLTNNHQRQDISLLKHTSRRHGLGLKNKLQVNNFLDLKDNKQKSDEAILTDKYRDYILTNNHRRQNLYADLQSQQTHISGTEDTNLKHNESTLKEKRKQPVLFPDNFSEDVNRNNHKEWDVPVLDKGKQRVNISIFEEKYQVPNFLNKKHYSQHNSAFKSTVKQYVSNYNNTHQNEENGDTFLVGQQRNLTEQPTNPFVLKVPGSSFENTQHKSSTFLSKFYQNSTDYLYQRKYSIPTKLYENVTDHQLSLQDISSSQPQKNSTENIGQQHNLFYQNYPLSKAIHSYQHMAENIPPPKVKFPLTFLKEQSQSFHNYPLTPKSLQVQESIQHTNLIPAENLQSSLTPAEIRQSSLIAAENRQSNRPPTWSNPPSVPWVDDPPVGQGTGLLPIMYLLAPLVVTAMLMPIGATLITAIVMLRSHHQVKGQGTQNKLEGNFSPAYKTLEENLLDAWSKFEEALSKYV